MTGFPRLFRLFPWWSLAALLALFVAGCTNQPPPLPPVPPVVVALPPPSVQPSQPAPLPAPTRPPSYAVMLGIDVLEAENFKTVAGKRIGLLTHAAGVNHRGESTAVVLHNAPNVNLVALFAPEHGLDSKGKAGEDFANSVDPRTKLPVYSFYDIGLTKANLDLHLRGLDALVIDLQDIGVRSYTFNVSMRNALVECFQRGIEVIILDRPNPLGGLKVDGPVLEPALASGEGAFRMPYVHGLTMGELAIWAKQDPLALSKPMPENVRKAGRLTVVPMRGWKRSMLWPDTGLKFIGTSQRIQDFDDVIGYAMIGLGCQEGGFTKGFDAAHPFQGLGFKNVKPEKLAADLTALRLPGLTFKVISTTLAPTPGAPAAALPKIQRSVYAEVTDWAAWTPTELSFQMMRLACRYDPPNPFAKLNTDKGRSFNILTGSIEWWKALKRDGAKVKLESFLATWRTQVKAYQQRSQPYWIYPP